MTAGHLGYAFALAIGVTGHLPLAHDCRTPRVGLHPSQWGCRTPVADTRPRLLDFMVHRTNCNPNPISPSPATRPLVTWEPSLVITIHKTCNWRRLLVSLTRRQPFRALGSVVYYAFYFSLGELCQSLCLLFISFFFLQLTETHSSSFPS